MDEIDAPRRTHLAAERTWLAWWRTGLAAAAASIAVGRLIPELVGGESWPYVVLGAAYGVLAFVLMGAAGLRQRQIRDSLLRGGFAELSDSWVLGLTVAGMLLTAFTVVLVVVA